MTWANRLHDALLRLTKAGKPNSEGEQSDTLASGSDVSQVRLLVAAAAAGALLVGASYLAIDKIQSGSDWMRVYTNGSYVGMVPNNETVIDGMSRVASGYNIDLTFDKVHTHVPASYDWQRVAELPTDAVAIRYNGKTLLYTATRSGAQRVLQDVEKALTPDNLRSSNTNASPELSGVNPKSGDVARQSSVANSKSSDANSTAGGVTVQFAGTVQLVDTQVAASSIFSPTAAVHYILTPSKSSLPGRSASLQSIADSAETKSSGVGESSEYGNSSGNSSGNPSSNGSSSAKGIPSARARSLTTVKSSTPLMTVKTVVRESKKVTLAYPVHYVNNPHMGAGTIKVTTPGKRGTATEDIVVTYVNGHQAKEQVLSKKVLQPPREEVAYKGTNAGVASGSWGWPTDRYDITSGFGWRNLGGRSDFHPGKDIGVPIGSPVYATNNGVVLQAGWNSGGYGNWVLIDNGNGIETIFGHLSHVDVHAGQVVAKGDLLGLSGDTGNSTGPHLHYEVRLNGKSIAPDKYM